MGSPREETRIFLVVEYKSQGNAQLKLELPLGNLTKCAGNIYPMKIIIDFSM